MWGKMITLLTILAGIVQQIVKNRAKRLDRDRDADHEKAVQKTQEDPAAWFKEHFGDGTTVVVRPPSPCDDAVVREEHPDADPDPSQADS